MFGKRAVLVAAALLLVSATANAGTYGMAGCGIGALILKDKPGKIQILASILNGIAASQLLGITSGTSQCTPADAAPAAEAPSANLDQELFLQTNRTYVMRDAAVGHGEYLATFATLLGCDASVQPLFFETTQKNMNALFDGQSDTEVLQKVKSTMAADPTLQASCARI